MAYLNSISIIGNLGRDAEIRVGRESGIKKATMSVACTERYKAKDGNVSENTQWFNVVCYGKLADTIERLSLKKGTCVYVGGKMSFRVYDKTDGTKSNIAELIANTLQILSPKAQAEAERVEQERSVESADDLPF